MPGRQRGSRRRSTGPRKNQPVEGVIVEETFPLYGASNLAGEGLYVSATTSGNKRYYGVLVDQPALKVASTLFFQDQGDSLSLNERMKLLLKQKEEKDAEQVQQQQKQLHEAPTEHGISSLDATLAGENVTKVNGTDSMNRSVEGMKAARAVSDHAEEDSKPAAKKARLDIKETPDVPTSSASSKPSSTTMPSNDVAKEKPVQKLKYIREDTSIKGRGKEKEAGYRILVATFSSILESSCGDLGKAEAIRVACEEGGNYLSGSYDDSYYYQFEVLPSSLTADESVSSDINMMRTSMGFNSFLQTNSLAFPPWYPLSNLHSQQKVLSMLNMKRDSKGKIKYEGLQHDEAIEITDATIVEGGTRLPMQPREKKRYEVGVIGAGIAGLACCKELSRLLHNDGIDAKVTLIEARSRIGGRLLTDRSWKSDKNKEFPLELGASWIHGINDNPLAALAKSAGTEFVTASEEVKMLGEGMKEVDSEVDDRMGKLFDDLLDHAADDCWTLTEDTTNSLKDGDAQAAVRWYASVFCGDDGSEKSSKRKEPPLVPPPPHRRSNDLSVDCEIGKAIARYRIRDFAKLTPSEHRMLLWNIKNVEYAIGANLNMMSTKYWDADERHAFDGDHVLIREGYSKVVDHMFEDLKSLGPDRFEYFLHFPVGRIEYGRKSASVPYGKDRLGRVRQLSELSDTCSVMSEDEKVTKFFDFLVCAVPLGVLKESVDKAKDTYYQKKITFTPSLPFTKVDAIKNVGFGLLNKVYLHFPKAFWRVPGVFKNKDDCLFGNITGVNPQHYMFFDVGRRLGSDDDAPAILMSLVSGKEAVALECSTDEEVVGEAMDTLRTIFSVPSIEVPDPISSKVTRWGKDRFSRGSYSYLPPGSTDQDFHLLQSPVNANGDSLLLEGDEVMRLFFAGEHTTALHPSMAHGAMLSGMRAAQEVVAAVQTKNIEDKDEDKVIPVAIFRHKNPTSPLQCSLCQKVGGHVREGALLAFKRGVRQVLCHNNCAEFSPEVEVFDSKWKNVIRAVNRGKNFNCEQCSLHGATIGCSANNCFRMFHFSCAEGKKNIH
jgi:lysine-specific histone demethylase 1